MTDRRVGDRSRVGAGRDGSGGPMQRRRPEPWRVRRRRRVAAAIAAGIMTVTLIWVCLWFTPLLSVRHVEVSGADVVASDEVVARLGIPLGTPLLRVDTAAAAARVGAIARIARVRVGRSFPSTIRVDVMERTAITYYDTSSGAHLLDSDGVEFGSGTPPDGLPRLQTPHPGPRDPVTHAALTVLAATPPSLRSSIKTIVARTISDITLILRDNRTVEWGSVARSDRKGLIAVALLTRPGHSYDISSPDLPTVR